ncbi:hypothetical protein MC7420_3595 [Coleofasciculus chthonoplastes PCC 7420]|uniref:Sulfotransferase domain superfamily n=1 Tax=Coleofasciculus chthonoplastes PCC 7420 TaxID=118168 RepID=B4VZZ6_9CYAN|nr:sulfotransferase family protein [Coleofasciculus chthonoplastes]EDX72523.1 hypothetical protein MC7420_3595 [Coleofasciculus chthonoplastes PCC 7420]
MDESKKNNRVKLISQEQKTTPICVLTAGRSGSSLTMQLLQSLGVYLGSEKFMIPRDRYNQTGYWEHRGFSDINSEILRRFGGNSNAPPWFPSGWELSSCLEDLENKAQILIENEFSQFSVWGWKDPKTCLVLPFWQKLLPETIYILSLRNPWDASKSQQKRSQYQINRSLNRWLYHIVQAMIYTSGKPRFFIFYEDTLLSEVKQRLRLKNFLETYQDLRLENRDNMVINKVDINLCHHQSSIDDLMANTTVTSQVKIAYLVLYGSVLYEENENNQHKYLENETIVKTIDGLFRSLHQELQVREYLIVKIWRYCVNYIPQYWKQNFIYFELSRVIRVYSQGGMSSVIRGFINQFSKRVK